MRQIAADPAVQERFLQGGARAVLEHAGGGGGARGPGAAEVAGDGADLRRAGGLIKPPGWADGRTSPAPETDQGCQIRRATVPYEPGAEGGNADAPIPAARSWAPRPPSSRSRPPHPPGRAGRTRFGIPTRRSRSSTRPSPAIASSTPWWSGCGPGARWSEGPVWFGDGRCLLWSDIPNNRILRWDEATRRGQRVPQAVQLLERQHPRPRGPPHHLRARRAPRHPHRARRHASRVLADSFEGKPLNSPNDVGGEVGRLDLVHRSRPTASLGVLRGRRGASRSCPPTSTGSIPRAAG